MRDFPPAFLGLRTHSIARAAWSMVVLIVLHEALHGGRDWVGREALALAFAQVPKIAWRCVRGQLQTRFIIRPS